MCKFAAQAVVLCTEETGREKASAEQDQREIVDPSSLLFLGTFAISSVSFSFSFVFLSFALLSLSLPVSLSLCPSLSLSLPFSFERTTKAADATRPAPAKTFADIFELPSRPSLIRMSRP